MTKWGLVGLTGLALVLRLLPLLLPFDFAGPDSATYLMPARSLLERGVLTPSTRPPGYPLFLALGLALAGGSLVGVRLLQAVLGALTVPLLHRVVAPRYGARAGWIAAGVAAVDPIAVGQSPFVLREGLLLFLLALLLWVLRLRGRRRYLLAGAVLAALTWIHPLYLLLGPFLALAEVAGAVGWSRRLARLRVWVGAGLVVALPLFLWGRHVQRQTGRFALAELPTAVPAHELWLTSACSNAWVSGDTATGFQALAWQEEARLVRERGLEGAKAELYARAARNWRQHPLRSLGRVLRQNLWYWLEIPGAVRLVNHPRLYLVRWGLLPFHWVRLCCAVAGVVALLRSGRWRGERATLGAVLFFLLAPAMLYPIPRYLAPAAPLLTVLAAIGLERSLRLREARA